MDSKRACQKFTLLGSLLSSYQPLVLFLGSKRTINRYADVADGGNSSLTLGNYKATQKKDRSE